MNMTAKLYSGNAPPADSSKTHYDCTNIHDTRISVATNPSVPLWYALYVSRYFRLHRYLSDHC